MPITPAMLALLNEKIQSPANPKGMEAYKKSLTAWSKAASKVAGSYQDKLGDAKPSAGSMSMATVISQLDKLLTAVSGELAQIADLTAKLK